MSSIVIGLLVVWLVMLHALLFTLLKVARSILEAVAYLMHKANLDDFEKYGGPMRAMHHYSRLAKKYGGELRGSRKVE